MEIKKCLIIDNDDVFDSFYFLILKKLPFLECEICNNTDDALKYIYSKSGVDLVIVNAAFLETFLKQMHIAPPIIVICKSEKQAIQALEMDNIVDILLLPFDRNRFLKALSKAWGLRHTENSVADSDSAFLKCGRMMKRFFFDRVEYVEAYGIYSKVYYEGIMIIVNESISNLEYLLIKRKFRRVHKSFIININNIQEIDSGGILLMNRNDRIPFGPKYKPLVASLFKLHVPENSSL